MTKEIKLNIFFNLQLKKLRMVNDITIEIVIDNWTTDYYLNILMWQCEETRYIIEKLQKLEDQNKLIIKSYVIGLLGRKLNNCLLDKYSVEEYLEGINTLCQFYNNYYSNEKQLIVKKSWMSNKHRLKLLS